MRRALVVIALSSGCSLLYDGSDLKGKAAAFKLTKSAYPGPDNPASALATGDFDGDGHVDVVLVSDTDPLMYVYLGHGDGSFSSARTVAAGCDNPNAVAAADLDGDGLADIIVTCNDDFGTTAARRLHAAGGGDFDAPATLNFGNGSPTAIDIADLNMDHIPDVVIADDNDGSIVILRGSGGGNFVTPDRHTTGSGPDGVTIADLDGDGIPDVAVANAGADSISILLNQGGNLATAVNYTSDGQPQSIAIGDFDGQNGPDLAVPTYSHFQLDLFLDQGGGTFPSTLPPSLMLSDGPSQIRTADFDKDGKLDLVVGSNGADTLQLFLGKGDGTFEAALSYDSPVPIGLAVADFDEDGRPDIAVAGSDTPGTLAVFVTR